MTERCENMNMQALRGVRFRWIAILSVGILLSLAIPAQATHEVTTPTDACPGAGTELKCHFSKDGTLVAVWTANYTAPTTGDAPRAVFVNPYFEADAISAGNVVGPIVNGREIRPAILPAIATSRSRLDSRSQTAALKVAPVRAVALGGQSAIANTTLVKLAQAIAGQTHKVKITRLSGHDRVDTMLATVLEYQGP